MKVKIRNLGVIKEEANFELKPLTVFIGPNNAGKTWLAYSLGGVLGPFGSGEYAQAYANKKVPNTYEQLDNAIERVLVKGNATIDLRRFADESGETYFNDIARYARNWMRRYLSTQLADFDDLDISLSLAESKVDFLNQVSQYSRTSRVAGSVLTIRKSPGEDKVFAFTSTEVGDTDGQETQLGEKIPLEEVRERLVGFVSTALRRSLYPQIRVFPTERTTLVASRFAERVADRVQPGINERVIEVLEALAKELDMRAVDEQNRAVREATWPVSSFMAMLHDIFRKRSRDREERERQARRDLNINRFNEIRVIQKELISHGFTDLDRLTSANNDLRPLLSGRGEAQRKCQRSIRAVEGNSRSNLVFASHLL